MPMTTDQVGLYQRAYIALRHSISNIYTSADTGANNWLLFKAILVTVPGEPVVTKTIYIPIQVRRSYSYNVTKLVLDQIESGISTTVLCDAFLTNAEVQSGGQYLQSLVSHFSMGTQVEKHEVLSHNYTHIVCVCASEDTAVAVRCDEVIVMNPEGKLSQCANCPEYHTAYGQWLTLSDPNTTDLGPDGTPEADEDTDGIVCCGDCNVCPYANARPLSTCNNKNPASDYTLELSNVNANWSTGKLEYPITIVGMIVTAESATDVTGILVDQGYSNLITEKLSLRAGDTATFNFNPGIHVNVLDPLQIKLPNLTVGSLSISLCYNKLVL